MFLRYRESPHELRLGYDFYADIAERIVEKRKAAGMTQEQLEKKARISSGKVAKYENVKIRCSLDDLDKISRALNTTTDYLIGAQYDDPDCGECIYTVWNERFETGKTDGSEFTLYFEASSPQMAFLKAYKWSIDAKIIWFEPRDRAHVRLEAIPVRKSHYADFKRRISEIEDAIFPNN